MLKKLLFICFIGIAINVNTYAQNYYTVSFPNLTYVALNTATSPTLTLAYPPSLAISQGVSTADEGAANNISLPFNFTFYNVSYNVINISTNGFLTLGSTAIIDTFEGYGNNNLVLGTIVTNGPVSRPIIAPLWDDMDLQLPSNLSYKTTGTTPNRVFTIQWSNVKWTWTAASSALSFQVKLYESSNVIDFHYKPTTTGTVSSGSATVGLANVATGSTNFLSMSGLTNTAISSISSETSNISSKPANNFAIRFTPINIALPMTLLSFTGHKEASANILKWTTTMEQNNAIFNVQRSKDGRTFTTIAKVNSKAINGNSSETIQYDLVDENPTIGYNYFRLEQIDNDGKINYSKVIDLYCEANDICVNIYPNPTTDILNLELSLLNNEDVSILLTDVSGRLIKEIQSTVLKGKNNIQLDLNEIKTGIYLIKVVQNNQIISTHKVEKKQ